jgi:hypothetical protein
MSYLRYLCLTLSPVVCRRVQQLEIKTNINNVNKTCALLQTTGGKVKHK